MLMEPKPPHVLPLDGRALEIIQGLYENRRLFCRHVFHGRYCAPGRSSSKAFGCIGDIKKSWTKACQAAGYPNAVFHDTRRAAVTHLANAGVPAHEIMESPDAEHARPLLHRDQRAEASHTRGGDRLPRGGAGEGHAEGAADPVSASFKHGVAELETHVETHRTIFHDARTVSA